MAAKTSTGSGLWSAVVGAADGDSVTIASGHDVVFDADHSAWTTGLVGLVVNGTLKFKSDSNTCLMMATNINISGTGTFGNPSTDPVQRPDAGKAYRCRIILKGTGQITVSNLTHYGWIPSLNYTTITTNANLNATTITLTDDLGVQQGDEIVIGSGTETGAMAETAKGVYTVQSYDSGTKTITLTSGLQTARLEGDYVAWLSRTTNIERTPAGNSTLTGATNVGQILQGVRLVGTRGTTAGYWTLIGCTIQNGYSGLVTGTNAGHLVDRCTANNNSTAGLAYAITGSTVKNSIAFNSTPLNLISVVYNYKVIAQNCASLLSSGTGCILSQCCGKNNSTADINTLYECMLYDGHLDSTVQVAGYRGNTTRKWINNESWNHNDVEGNYRAWMKGGYIFTDNTRYYSGTTSLKFVIEEDSPVFREYFLYFPSNEKKKIKIPVYKDFTGGTVKAQIIDPKRDPIIDETQSPLVETNGVDVANEWQVLNISYTSPYTRLLLLRVYIQNTSGNAWVDTDSIKNYSVERLMQCKKNFIFA